MINTKTMTREQGTAAIKTIMADPRFSPEVKSYIKQSCSYPDADTIVYQYGTTDYQGEYGVKMAAAIIPWVDEIFRAI